MSKPETTIKTVCPNLLSSLVYNFNYAVLRTQTEFQNVSWAWPVVTKLRPGVKSGPRNHFNRPQRDFVNIEKKLFRKFCWFGRM